MTILHAALAAVLLVVAAKTLAWLIQLRTGNAGMVDPIWAFTLGGLAAWFAWAGDAPLMVRMAMGLMGAIWGIRLGWQLLRRNWGAKEDWRYAKFRAEWGDKANGRMFWFFQFQNLFTLMLAGFAFLPLAYRDGTPPLACLIAAVGIWLASVVGEWVSDSQMDAFRRDPANQGKVCRVGLWRYSRHPNYFFECLHWMAYPLLAWGMPGWWLSLGAPLVMAYLLTQLSGMPLMEAEMARRKPGYAEYMRTTSPLIPWPPRKSAGET